MTNKITSYLRLAWLCFELGFRLFLFSLSVLWLKFNQKTFWLSLNIVLLCLIWVSNFYIFYRKNTPQLEINRAEILKKELENPLLKERVSLTETQVVEKLENYKKIEQANIHSLGVWLNLSQLNKFLGNEDLAQEYLNKAKTITPYIRYLEN